MQQRMPTNLNASSASFAIPVAQNNIKNNVIAGRPVFMRIPSLDLELKIDEGHYNPADASWTLSGYNAYYAMPTMPGNNQEGNTLVYGHNNKHVFGPLKNLKEGVELELKTDNGHIFYYAYESSQAVQPDDLTIFTYQGPPILTLQTCSGNWHELRTLSRFNLTRVIRFNPDAEKDRINREKLVRQLMNLTSTAYPKNEQVLY